MELYSTPRIFFHGTAEGHFTEVHSNFILQRSLIAAIRLGKPLPYDSIKNWPYLPLCFVVRLALYTLTIWPAHEITLTVKKKKPVDPPAVALLRHNFTNFAHAHFTVTTPE